MALPLNIIPIHSFLGTHEDVNTLILADVFSPSGSQNVYVDKRGRIKKILGYDNRNSSAYTTNTGASAAKVVGLFPYKTVSGTTVTRHLVYVLDDDTNEWEIWTSTDGGTTGTFRYDAGSGSVGRFPDFAQYRNTLYVSNGVVVARKWDGTTLSAVGFTQSPTVTSVPGTGTNLTGQYKWKLVAVEADGTRHAGSVASTNLLLSGEGAALSWTADADTDVVGYEVWRTTGTGNVYYFVTMIDGRTTVAYTDDTSDNTILGRRSLQDHGDAPPISWFNELHKERMWWGRTDANPNRVYFSDPGLPESVGGDSYIDFSDATSTGGVITGMVGDYAGRLVVFTEDAIWSVAGTGAIIAGIRDWYRRKSNAGVGSVSHRTVVKVPKGAVYVDKQGQAHTTDAQRLAYLTPNNDIRIFDGTNDEIISFPVVDSLATHNWTYREKAFAVHDPETHHIIWFYADGASTFPNKAVAWNYQAGSWHRWFSYSFASGTTLEAADDPSTVVLGSGAVADGAYIYTWWTGNSFNGTAIDARWMTNTIRGMIGQDPKDNAPTGPADAHRKRWRWINLLTSTTSGVTLTLEWFKGDAGEGETAVGSRTFTTADADRDVTANQLILRASDATNWFHDEGIRFRIKDNATTGSWAVHGLTLAYQLLPGLKRRIT